MGIGREMLQKYPGGRWATMNGRHIYIKKGGEIASETDPGVEGSRNVRQEADGLLETPVAGIQTGDLFRYRNRTVTIGKVGRKWVQIEAADGTKYKVDKKKFAAEAEEQPKPGEEQPTGQPGEQPTGQPGEQPIKSADEFHQKLKETIEQGQTKPDLQTAEDTEPGAKGGKDAQGQDLNNTAIAKAETAEPILPNIGEITSTDDIISTYKEWSKQGGTLYFEDHLPRAWWPVELAKEQGNPAAAGRKIVTVQDRSGKTVGMCYAYPDREKGDMHILLAESAPMHRVDSGNADRERGIGARMIAQVVAESMHQGFGGKVSLLSLARSATQDFYESLGFTKKKSDSKLMPGASLQYELLPEAAQKLLEGVKQRYGSLQKSFTNKGTSKSELNWDRIESLEDDLGGFIQGPISALMGAHMKSVLRTDPLDNEGGEGNEAGAGFAEERQSGQKEAPARW